MKNKSLILTFSTSITILIISIILISIKTVNAQDKSEQIIANLTLENEQLKNECTELSINIENIKQDYENTLSENDNLKNEIANYEQDIKNLNDELLVYKNIKAVKENHEVIIDTYTCKNGKEMQYALYIPNGIDSTDKPLIFYMHGSAERGNNINQLKNADKSFSKSIFDDKIIKDCYILMPQLPNGRWIDYDEDLMNLINQIIENHNIDTSKISVTGHSLGGWGTIDFVCKYPTFFYKAAPMSAVVSNNDYKNIEIPIWFLVGSNDNPNSFIKTNDEFNEYGKDSQITVYEDEGHCITNHYLDNDCEIVDWLIE